MWNDQRIDDACNAIARNHDEGLPSEVKPLLRQMRDEYELRLDASGTALQECMDEAQPALALVALLGALDMYIRLAHYTLYCNAAGQWVVKRIDDVIFVGDLAGAIAALKQAARVE